jgi:hypothetical protein
MLMAAYAGWIESSISLRANRGIGFCRIVAATAGVGIDWFASACWGY